MTTTGTTFTLDRVDKALVIAHDVLAREADAQVVEDALVALCRTAYDALVAWDVTSADPEPQPALGPETWRTPLDDLRVQAALAELELRAAGAPGVEAADRFVRTVSNRLAAGRREIGEALDALRGELRRLAP